MRLINKIVKPIRSNRLRSIAKWCDLVLLPVVRRTTKKSDRTLRWIAGKVFPVILCGGIGLLLARSILTSNPHQVIATVVGILVCGLVLARIQIGLIATIILAASIMHYSFVPKPVTIAGQGLSAIELLVALMVVVLLPRAFVRRELLRLKNPITLPLISLGGAAALAILTGYMKYLDDPYGPWQFREVYNSCRPLFLYSFFFAVILGVNTRRDLKLFLNITLVIMMVVSLMMVAQYYAGPSTKLFLGTEAGLRVESLSSEERSVTRSLPPGMSLILLLFPTTMLLACIGDKKNRLWYGIAGTLLGVGIIFNLTRMAWVTTIFALILIWLFSSRTIKKRLALVLLIAPVLIIGGSMTVGRMAPGSAGQRFSKALTNRFTSIFKHETLMSSSLQHRFQENRYAMRQIKKSPVFGIGLGAPVYYAQGRYGGGQQIIIPEQVIHNSYLNLWMVYGLFGVISLLWLSIAFLWRCLYVFLKCQDPMYKAIAIGSFAAYIGFLIRCYGSMSFLHENYSILALALVWGMVEVVARLETPDSLDSPKPIDVLQSATSETKARPGTQAYSYDR